MYRLGVGAVWLGCLAAAAALVAGCGREADHVGPPPTTGVSVLVRPDGTGDYQTIQDAVNAVASGDTVLLENGVFTGDGNRWVDFKGKAILVTSRSGDPDSCIIDCESVNRGFSFHSGETSSAVLSGITVTRGVGVAGFGGAIYCSGASPTLRDMVFLANTADRGGALYCDRGAAPVLDNVLFTGNTAGMGGGMYLWEDCQASLTLCTFKDNHAGRGGGLACEGGCSLALSTCEFEGNVASWEAGEGYGGGMACEDCPLLALSCCRFIANEAERGNGGGMYMSRCNSAAFTCVRFAGNASAGNGGGLACLFSSPELRFCSFENNTVTHWGGRGAGMWVGTGGSAPIIMDTTFSENSVSAGDDGGGGLDAETGTISPTHLTVLDCLFESNAGSRGGGLNCHDATISGCVFWGNSATDRGGAILCHGDVTLTGCTLSRNSTPGHGGGVGINGDAVVEIANCIVASALDGEGIYVYPGYPPPSIACSDIFGNADGDWIEEIADQYGVDGNISEDPLFCDEDAGDVATYDDSPCSPDSSGCGELIGACGVGCFSR